MTKVWSKLQPGVTAEVLGPKDHRGFSPAIVTGLDEQGPLSLSINLNEWSTVEVVPAPAPVPDTGYLLMYGDDPSEVKYEFYENEIDVAVASHKKGTSSFGYCPVLIQRYATIPPYTD